VRYLSADIDRKRIIDEELEGFLSALFYFPTQAYDEIWRSPRFRLRNEAHKVRHYLWEEPLLRRAVENGTYDVWSSLCDVSRRVVDDRAFEEHLSGTRNPLIALPHYVRELMERGEVRSEGEIDSLERRITMLLRRLRGFLHGAEMLVTQKRVGTDTAVEAARRALEAYAAYGYRWMAFAKCVVPLGDPFMIEVKEERALYFARKKPNEYKTVRKIPFGEYLGKTAWKNVSFADAETNHVSIRVADTAVRMLRNCQSFKANGERAEKEVDEEAKTFELYLRHSSLKRPERLWVKCHLRLARVTSCFLYLAMVITAFAVFLLVSRGAMEHPLSTATHGYKVSMEGNNGTIKPVKTEKDYTHGLTAKDATLILVPAAFVASFLLVKDSSTLVMRVRRFRQAILVCEFFILLVVAFSLFAARDVWSSP
jgi:hypothetical protein